MGSERRVCAQAPGWLAFACYCASFSRTKTTNGFSSQDSTTQVHPLQTCLFEEKGSAQPTPRDTHTATRQHQQHDTPHRCSEKYTPHANPPGRPTGRQHTQPARGRNTLLPKPSHNTKQRAAAHSPRPATGQETAPPRA